jgi:hypothetical protein
MKHLTIAVCFLLLFCTYGQISAADNAEPVKLPKDPDVTLSVDQMKADFAVAFAVKLTGLKIVVPDKAIGEMPVTFKIENQPLSVLLGEICKQTGTKIKVGKDGVIFLVK